MQLARTRVLLFLGFIASVLSLGAAFYLQYAVGLEPCMLCRWQRVLLVGCALICLVACLHRPAARGWNLYALSLLLAALAGSGVAGAQVWLQTSALEEKGLALGMLERILPAGPGDLHAELLHCAEINWSLFGISLPEWSLLLFIALMLPGLYALSGQVARRVRRRDQTSV